MLKNLYILSENSWGIKSSEIFADFFYFLTLVIFFGCSVAFVTPVPVLSIVLGCILTLVYFAFCIRIKQAPYWLGLLSQLFLVFLIVPLAWLSPVLLSFGLVFAFALHYFLIQQNSIRIPLFSLVILFLFLFDTAFSLMGYQLHGEYSLQSMVGIPIESSILPMTLPWLSTATNHVAFVSIAESLGIYLFAAVAWVSFRRTILISFFFGWLILFFVWGLGSGMNEFTWNLSFASLAFFLQMAPGRNFYGSFYVTIVCFFILLPLAFFVGKLGISAIWVVVVFFLIESLLVRVFLGK
ncbi:hypothetical protein AB3N58_13090 [Leptospira sp. WS60.C2]